MAKLRRPNRIFQVSSRFFDTKVGPCFVFIAQKESEVRKFCSEYLNLIGKVAKVDVTHIGYARKNVRSGIVGEISKSS